jgi:PAS domain S-box-containing protein
MAGLAALWTRLHPLLYFAAGIVWTLLTAVLLGWSIGDEPRLMLLGGAVSAAVFVGLSTVALTLRARAEEAQAELASSAADARTLLQEVINASAAPIYVFDREGRALLMNEASAQVIGRPVASLIGRTRASMHPLECATAHDDFDRQVVESGHPMSFEERAQGADGERVFLSMKFPLRTAAGDIYAVGGVSTEITELRRAQEAAASANARLEGIVQARTQELVASRDRAEQADRAKTVFLSTVSHELRTPLNSIIGFTDIVVQGLAGPLTDEQRHQLSIVQESAHILLELINEILDISRIEAGKLHLSPQEFDLADLLQRRCDAMASAAARKGLRLEARVAPSVGHVTSDPMRVAQIVSNLLANAIKFTDHGSVVLEARGDDARVTIVVQDTGPGISADDITRLFRPFVQVGGSGTRNREGTGLGLVISQYLAYAMGGEISVQSTPGAGSRFELQLPRKYAGMGDVANTGIYRKLLPET